MITLQRSGLKRHGYGSAVSGVDVHSKDAPMSLLLLGTVNLHLAQVFAPDISSSGELKFNINTNGATNSPDFAGEVDIVDANFASGDLPVGLQHGNGVLSLTKDRLNITKFQGTVGGGTVTAQGGVAYRPAIQFDLGLAANGCSRVVSGRRSRNCKRQSSACGHHRQCGSGRAGQSRRSLVYSGLRSEQLHRSIFGRCFSAAHAGESARIFS